MKSGTETRHIVKQVYASLFLSQDYVTNLEPFNQAGV
jgi:hypothetical protein